MAHVRLLFTLVGQNPTIKIKLNGAVINHKTDWTPDEFGNINVEFNEVLSNLNSIEVDVHNLAGSINLVEIIADDIRFGIVTFLCTTISKKQDTQLNNDGIIKIELNEPIWQYWCEKFNDFNYKDYPLGSVN